MYIDPETFKDGTQEPFTGEVVRSGNAERSGLSLPVSDNLYEGVSGIPEPQMPPMSGSTIIDKLTPTQLYFGQQLAVNAKYMNRSTDYLPLFTQGVGPDEIYQRERSAEQASQAANEVMDMKDRAEQFVTQNANLKEKEYEAAKAKFLSEQENLPQRQTAPRRAPGALEIGLALFGAAMNPQFAANIMAAPFQARDDNYRRNQSQFDQRYEDDVQAHRERLTALGRLVQFAQEDMQKAQAANAKLAESINKMLSADKPGIPTLALQEAIAAGLPADRIEMYRTIAAKREESLAAQERLKMLDMERKEAMTSAQIADLTSKVNERNTMLPGKVDQQGARTGQINSQTANLDAKTQTENDTRKGKVAKLEAEVSRIKQSTLQSKAQIDKWKADVAAASARGTLERDKFEWLKKNPKAGSSRAESLMLTLQKNKAGLLAEAESWRSQYPDSGLIQRDSPQSDAAMERIRREISAIDGQIDFLRGMGVEDQNLPAPIDKVSIRKRIAATPDKARANAAIRAIDDGADAQAVYRRFFGGG